MGEKFYVIIKIDGEYAYLREVDKGEESDVFVALYLLPMGVTVGSKLRSQFFEYELIN
ncbi:MAG: chorismate--pyruvate lyase [Clostridia bacterium]|nr:chorismate--pyruvate lyase [Clostridia bacterium]